jgi:Right handed beta helix region
MRNIVYLRVLLFVGLASALASMLSSPARAQSLFIDTWVSGIGSDSHTTSGCQRSAPCQSLGAALGVTTFGRTIFCSDPGSTISGAGAGTLTISTSVTIDCSEGFHAVAGSLLGGTAIIINAAGVTVTLRNLTIYGSGDNPTGISITAASLVRLENCKILGFGGAGVDVAPSSGNIVVKIQDSTITQNTPGVLVAPTGSASVSISIDRSQIENNNGGGVKTNVTSGAINASISDSSMSFNANNGLVALGGAGGQNMVSIRNDVIASNGQAGIEASGGNAAVLVNNTLLDSNTLGALQAVSGGRILTYQNNNIIGSPGSGFTGTASPQ